MHTRGFTGPVRRCRVILLRSLIAACLLAGGLSHAPCQAPAAAADAAPADRFAAAAEEHVQRGEIFAAVEDLEKAVAADPDRLDLLLRLAGLEKDRGMWLRSAQHYRRILAVDPNHSDARLGYAELLLADYQFRAAAEQFRLLLKDNPDHTMADRALVGLGSSLFGRQPAGCCDLPSPSNANPRLRVHHEIAKPIRSLTPSSRDEGPAGLPIPPEDLDDRRSQSP